MSIRFECPECQSVLKIKEKLAGTDGKCPKCKTPFVVPTLEAAAASGALEDSTAADTSPAAVEAGTATAPAAKPKKKAKVEAPAAAAAGDDGDFDPVAFLMEGGPPKKAKTAPPPEDKPKRPAERQVPVDRGGGLSLDDDDEPAQAPKPRSKGKETKPPAPEPMSAAASANSMLSASSNAKDLLTRTVEESRARAAEMPEETKVPFIDTAQLKMLLFTRILPYGGGLIVLCACLYWLANSMYGSGGTELPDELIAAEGVVLINGEPTQGVVVSMRPFAEREAGGRWRTSTAVTNEDGEFEMVFLEGYEGIVPGRQQVSLSYIVDGMETAGAEWIEPGKVMTFEESTYDIKIESGSQARATQQPAPEENQ